MVLGCYEGGFWVTQHPEVTVDVLGHPMSGFGAFKGGFWGTQWGGGVLGYPMGGFGVFGGGF